MRNSLNLVCVVTHDATPPKSVNAPKVKVRARVNVGGRNQFVNIQCWREGEVTDALLLARKDQIVEVEDAIAGASALWNTKAKRCMTWLEANDPVSVVVRDNDEGDEDDE